MELELTQEEITKSVNAAYDSVLLISNLNAQEALTEEDSDTLSRNIEHISIMLQKEWFLNALTSEQVSELNGLL
jgi:hypothetical protein